MSSRGAIAAHETKLDIVSNHVRLRRLRHIHAIHRWKFLRIEVKSVLLIASATVLLQLLNHTHTEERKVKLSKIFTVSEDKRFLELFFSFSL